MKPELMVLAFLVYWVLSAYIVDRIESKKGGMFFHVVRPQLWILAPLVWYLSVIELYGRRDY